MKTILILAVATSFLLTAQTSSDASVFRSGTVQIRNKKFGDLLRPLDASNKDGAPIVLYSAQPWKCMTWKVTPRGQSSFVLENLFTSKTLAPDPARGSESARVSQTPLSREAPQQQVWKFVPVSGGLYQISDPASGKCLAASPNPGGHYVGISVSPCQAGDEQKWEVMKAPEKLTM